MMNHSFLLESLKMAECQTVILALKTYKPSVTQYVSWMCEKMEQIADIESWAGARIDAIAETGISFMRIMG
jgi:hypothetical protein